MHTYLTHIFLAAMLALTSSACASTQKTQNVINAITKPVVFDLGNLRKMSTEDLLRCPNPEFDACMLSPHVRDCPRLFLDAAIDAANLGNDDPPSYSLQGITNWGRAVHAQYNIPDSTLTLLIHQRFDPKWIWYQRIAGSPTPETLLATNRAEAMAQLHGEYALKRKAMGKRMSTRWTEAETEYRRLTSLFEAMERLALEDRQ